jgi:hypothetical protein
VVFPDGQALAARGIEDEAAKELGIHGGGDRRRFQM